MRVPNPKRPLGDVTGIVKRTLLRPKPDGEAVEFSVPALISNDLWEKATKNLRRRGRGRGKQGKSIQALLRRRIFCPRCGKPMVVRRKSGKQAIYYHCSRHYRSWSPDCCSFRSFVPGNWDEMVWDCVHALLMQDTWLDEYLSSVKDQKIDVERLIRSEQQKIFRFQNKITKIREGYEAGIYGIDDAKVRITENQDAIGKSEQETRRIREQVDNYSTLTLDKDALRQELQQLATKNLEKVTFEEKLDIISKLGIRVYPSEDLKTMKVKCGLKPLAEGDNNGSINENGCGIVLFGLPKLNRPFPMWNVASFFEESGCQDTRSTDTLILVFPQQNGKWLVPKNVRF